MMTEIEAVDYRHRWDHALASKRCRGAVPTGGLALPTYIAAPVVGMLRQGRFADVQDLLEADWLADYRLTGQFDGVLGALEDLLARSEDDSDLTSASASAGELEEEAPAARGRDRPPSLPPPTDLLAFDVRRHAPPPTSRHREVPVT